VHDGPGSPPVKSLLATTRIDAECAARLVSIASDIALVVGADDVIEDLAIGSDDLAAALHGRALGGRVEDVVTVESRQKMREIVEEARANGITRWRQINHFASGVGSDAPVQYCGLGLGASRVLLVGRDLTSNALLQQRLVDAQQALERDYWHLRQVENRYRLLFQTAREAVFILDARTGRIEEANSTAHALLAPGDGSLVGSTLTSWLDDAAAETFAERLLEVRTTGRAAELPIPVKGKSCTLAVSALRHGDTVHAIVRLVEASPEPPAASPAHVRLLEVVEAAPDGIVVTNAEGGLVAANAAFLDMAQLASEDLGRGRPLEHWLGRPGGVDSAVLLANLKRYGSVRLFPTTVRAESGTTTAVELCAMTLQRRDGPRAYGFILRDVGRRLEASAPTRGVGARSVEQLAELVGRVPLKDLVRESTDLIERLCIEAALELTEDNRASAAEMLGLSRQSLYVKLRRYGMAT
jgi:transcriptional regulator PpsR